MNDRASTHRAALDDLPSDLLDGLLADLRREVRGPVLVPGDTEYAAAVGGFDLAMVHRPPVAVVAGSAADVSATLRLAARYEQRVTVVGGGHGDIARVTDGVWLTTRALQAVSVDATARTARVQTGATWSAVVAASTPYGLAPLCGSAPEVGVGGFLLGGGLGPLSRTYGIGSDYVRSVEIVLADGSVVEASADSHPDLFWALRGGKGGFGVVTAVSLELIELRTFYGGGEYYPADDVAGLLRAYAQFTAGELPPELSTSLAILRLPDLPVLPPPLRGRLVAHLRVAYVGAADAAETLLAPLRRATGAPLLGALSELSYDQLGSIHNDPTHPSAHATAGILLDRFDGDTAEAILAVAGPQVPAPLAIVEIRHFGGAIRGAGDDAAGGGTDDAVSGRTAGFGLWVSGAPLPAPADPEQLAGTAAAVRSVLTAVSPWSTGTVQINFCGSENTAAEAAHAWSADVAERLETVRRRYDPDRRFTYRPGCAAEEPALAGH